MLKKNLFLKFIVTTSLLAMAPQAFAQQEDKITRQEYDDLASKLIDAEVKCKDGEAGSRVDYLAARKVFEASLPEDTRGLSPYLLNERKKLDPNMKRGQDIDYEQEGYFRRRYDRQFPLLDKCPPTPKKTYVPHDLTKSAFRIFTGYNFVKPPQAGYGVEIVPGVEKFVAMTDISLTGLVLGGSITSKDNKWIISMEYADLEGSSEGQIANGTENVGFVFHDRAPSGSTGVNLGPRGLDVSTNSVTTRLRLQFDMSTETDSGVAFGARFRHRIAVGPGIRRADTEHIASVTSRFFNDISSDSSQKINENFYYLNGYSSLSFKSNGNKQGGFGIYITPRIEAGYRDASLDSRQTNICGLCSASDQNFTINIDDDDNGFYYDASLKTDIGYNITDTVKLGISGNIGWRSKTARIVNPETGDDLFIRNNPTHLETDSEFRQGITAWFSAEF